MPSSFQSAVISPLLDWFTPQELQRDATLHRRARMYLLAHVFGPPFGLSLGFFLYFIDPAPDLGFWVIIGAFVAFYVYPFVLRRTGQLSFIAPISVQHLTFAILLSSYEYGGVSSPFLTWIGAVPLVCAFYLVDRPRLRLVVLALVAAQILAFYAVDRLGYSFPQRVPLAALSGIGIASALCTCAFVAMMSIYYAGVVAAQQVELEREVDSHRVTGLKLRQAKEDAERADRAKSAFLANTSHELRTPLNAIIGFSEVIRNETFGRIDNPRYLEYVKDIHDSGRHLLRIINDILDLSKIEAGKAMPDKEEMVDLVAAIDAAARMVQPQAEAETIAVLLDLDEGLPTMIGSERMLRQVFINLLTNAVKFTPSGGRVSVRAALTHDGEVAVRISDTGIGMREEDIGVALTAFGQLDSEIARKYDGTGLGLPLAKAIVELHRGSLEIKSAPGQGTAVTVTLPLERDLHPPGAGARRASHALAAISAD